MNKYNFEKDGINYTVYTYCLGSDDISATHHCIICGTKFNSDKDLVKCPNGCEGLIRKNETW